MAAIVRETRPATVRKVRVYGLGPGICKRRGCGKPTVTGDIRLCPEHWEKTYHCAYPALTWRSEGDKLTDWLTGLPTPTKPSSDECV